MKPRHLYLLLSVAGFLLPFSQFAPWLLQHGPDVPLMMKELFANRISSFFALDVILSACVVSVFAALERRRSRMGLWWPPILATLAVGVSFGLPLLLYPRERPETVS